METVVALPIAAVFVLSLYGLFGLGFNVVGQSREDLRATQIMLKQVERIRLCPFNQLTNTVYNPQTLTDYFDPTGQPTGGGGTVYTVTFSATTPSSGTLPDSYRTSMLLVTVGTTWTSGKVRHTRSMQTYVAQNGMESYISAGR
jgi:hypothetical protein